MLYDEIKMDRSNAVRKLARFFKFMWSIRFLKVRNIIVVITMTLGKAGLDSFARYDVKIK